jgi:asparagine synthase (glutamine-hydrolysing)
MCGIAGFASTQPYPAAKPAVQAMVRSLERRGPDSQGIADWPHAILGHRRLAILDLSPAGHQPMLSDDGRVGLVFNGCIYNFRDLRRELEQSGCLFRSNSDTEVLLHGYRQWGIDRLLERARGMFALAVWDQPRRTMTLARDRLGVKPLLYSVRDGQIVFASTLTALRAAGVVGDVDPQAVLEFLEFGYVTDGRAVFKGASKLPAAGILEWRDGEIIKRSYWSLPPVKEFPKITFDEAVEETERLLVEAVGLRLYADVPVGVLLSAGIDSALVCWAMTRHDSKVTAFTVAAPGDPADEAPQAAETARILGIPHQVVTLTADPPDLLRELIEAYGEPFGCSSALAMLRVCRLIKPMATVLLTGDGGDDVFLGYPFHRDFWLAQRLANSLPDCALPLWLRARERLSDSGLLRRPKHFLDYATGGLGAVTQVHDGLPYYLERQMLGERLAGNQLSQRGIPLSSESARRLLADVLEYEQKTRFVGEFLTKVDGASMHYALEARSPFLDHKIWEFAAALPFQMRLRNGKLKAILREIVRRNVSPEVAVRTKRGFTVPVERWLSTRWRSAMDDLAHEPLLEREGWIRPGTLTAAVRETDRQASLPTQIWHLLVLEYWLRAAHDSRKTGQPTQPKPTP